MAKIEQTISMDIRLGDMKIGSNQGDQQRVEKIVDQLVEDFPSFVDVRFCQFLL